MFKNPIKYTPSQWLISLSLLIFSIFMFMNEYFQPIIAQDAGRLLIYFIGWLGFILYLYLLVKNDPEVFMTSFYQIFYYSSVLVGSTAVSFGSYMNEIRRSGTANGTFWLLLFSFLLTIESIRAGYKIVERRRNEISPRAPEEIDYITSGILVFFISLLGLFVLIRYGSPVLIGVNRVLYWGTIAPESLSFVRVLILLSFFLVSSLSIRISNNWPSTTFGKLSIIVYILLGFILLGEKFSLFVIFMSAWLFVYAAKRERARPTRVGIAIACVISILIGVAAYRYESEGLGLHFVLDRLALQAQLPWSSMSEPSDVLMHGLGYISGGIDLLSLRQELSGRYLPANVLSAHDISGTSLSGFMPTWQIMVFGGLASIFLVILFGLFLGAIQNIIIGNIRNGRIMFSFILYSAHFFVLSAWYVGNFNVIPIVALLAFIILLFNLSPKRRFMISGEGRNGYIH